ELTERVQSQTLSAALVAMFPDSVKRLKELNDMRTESRRDHRACRVVAVENVDGKEFATANPTLRHLMHAQDGYDYFILKDNQAPKTMRLKERDFTHNGLGIYKGPPG